MKVKIFLTSVVVGLTGLAIGLGCGATTPQVQSAETKEVAILPQDYRYYYDVPLSLSEQDDIRDVCLDFGVEEPLVYAVIMHESDFQKDLIDGQDWGLMQINECNHERFIAEGVTLFLDVRQNVYCGVSLLSEYLKKYDSVEKALMCYNLGEVGARAEWRKGITHNSYTDTILMDYAHIKDCGRYLCRNV